MADFDLVVVGGKVWTPGGWIEDAQVVIEGERVVEVRPGGIPRAAALEEIDATGKLVIPGLIDTHSHHRDPGFTHKEDITTASRAAAAGGVTMTIGMPNVDPPTTTPELFEALIESYSSRSVVDFNHNPAPTDLTSVPRLAELGCLGFKVFMVVDAKRPYPHMPGLGVHDHGRLVEILETVAATGRPLMVHPNDQEVHELIERRNFAAEAYGVEAYAKAEWVYDGLVWNSAVASLLEIQRGAGGRLHVLHMMSARMVELIRRAKAEGASVTAEVNAFGLFLSKWEEVGHKGPYALGRCLKEEWIDALWKGIADGTIDVLGTDHAPHTEEEKEPGWENMWTAPTGTPQLQHYLMKLLDASQRGLVDLDDVVRITSYNPARIFGLYPKKGTIEPGADADLVVIDPQREFLISKEDVLSKCGWTPYEGETVRGVPTMTILRGRIVMRDGDVLATPGYGRFVPPVEGS